MGNTKYIQNSPKQAIIREPSTAFTRRDKLGSSHRKILRFLKINNSPSLKDLNLSVGISYGQSERLRNRLRRLGLIDWVERVVALLFKSYKAGGLVTIR